MHLLTTGRRDVQANKTLDRRSLYTGSVDAANDAYFTSSIYAWTSWDVEGNAFALVVLRSRILGETLDNVA